MENFWIERRSNILKNRPFSDYRGDYTRDRARVIHSASFRRLQAKTQVLGIGEGDFHRTRLTHSMEVSQIARGIVNFLKNDSKKEKTVNGILPNTNLIETIALSHDLGHPPFGHGGEAALNFCMKKHGGFEGNGQTLRILARLEAHTDTYGLDVTRRCLLGVIKYPILYSEAMKHVPIDFINSKFSHSDWKPPKCLLDTELDVFNWVISPFSDNDKLNYRSYTISSTNLYCKSTYKAFDTSILEIADDIAYGVHDFEDAIALGLISSDSWDKMKINNFKDILEKYGTSESELYQNLFKKGFNERKQAIGSLVNIFVTSTIVDFQDFEHPLLRHKILLNNTAKNLLDVFKEIVYEDVITSQQVQTLEYRGEQLIIKLFDALTSDPKRLLPKELTTSLNGSSDDKTHEYRIVCDYIASMTNEYATRLYERLFVPRQGNFSDRL